MPQRSLGVLLSERCAKAWVVSAATGEPTGYAKYEKHPDLLTNTEIIRSGDD